MLRARRLLILKAGDTLASVQEARGDFDVLFRRALDGEGFSLEVVEVARGEPLPRAELGDAAIITGSPHSVTALEPWAEALVEWTQAFVQARRPLLGVCYGHQLLAHAEGGRVTQNVNGYEVGTVLVKLTPEGLADPLLGPLGDRGALHVHSTHNDAVVALPPHARRLAFNEMTSVQAFAIGAHAWGVQFHPEFDETIMRCYVEGREPLIRSSAERLGRDPEEEVRKARESIRPAPAGPALLRSFLSLAGTLLG